MPNRSVLNKYALFASTVQKVKRKRAIEKTDAGVIMRARLFALLSSSHCWHVYKFIHGNGFDKDAIAGEVGIAMNEGWKDINEDEMKEVITGEIDQHAFSMVLLCSQLEKEERTRYQNLLTELKEEFVDGMEPILREEEA